MDGYEQGMDTRVGNGEGAGGAVEAPAAWTSITWLTGDAPHHSSPPREALSSRRGTRLSFGTHAPPSPSKIGLMSNATPNNTRRTSQTFYQPHITLSK
ncbi:hypothetical protein E2C01_029961 [Portunus trituberculatus]|uniref:Uncharacterized protein n=1 Tax=Portunus trituberculatus TaxID=210409 RepID=A0A5B7EPP3_PORTR|nr:hypothetical protein [Portunus trituberculatus]